MPPPSAYTRADSYRALTNATKQTQADRVIELLQAMRKHGQANASARELVQAWNARFVAGGAWPMETSTMARVVNELILARRLERDRRRPCRVSGIDIAPVRLVAQQAALMGGVL